MAFEGDTVDRKSDEASSTRCDGAGPASRAPVVSLAGYRAAVRAAQFLAGTLERVPWVLAVQAEVVEDGEVVIAVVVEPPLSTMRRRVLPTRVDGQRVVPREADGP